MRILWITHDPIRSFIGKGQSPSGFWKESLLKLLRTETSDTISVAFPGKQREVVDAESYSFRYSTRKIFHGLPGETITDLQWIIKEFNPELIHVHGTEIPYGLIAEHTKVPVVVSLQGFISEWYNGLLGDIALPVWKKYKTLKEYVLRNGYPDMHAYWFKNAECERDVVRKNKYFIGRTTFDKYFVLKSNESATYFTGHELLRDSFYETNWDISTIQRHSLYTSLFINPVKGFHVLLEAISYLKKDYPNIKINVAGQLTEKMTSMFTGNAYFRYLKELIETKNLSAHVNFCGKLEGYQIADILKQTHVFALPSYMENSSNALGEAMISGVPCIGSDCGGTESIIENNVNGLIFNRGNAYELAQLIRKVFEDDELAIKLSAKGKEFGSAFHSKKLILNQYKDIYAKILALKKA